jgi:hypothetical protein
VCYVVAGVGALGGIVVLNGAAVAATGLGGLAVAKFVEENPSLSRKFLGQQKPSTIILFVVLYRTKILVDSTHRTKTSCSTLTTQTFLRNLHRVILLLVKSVEQKTRSIRTSTSLKGQKPPTNYIPV